MVQRLGNSDHLIKNNSIRVLLVESFLLRGEVSIEQKDYPNRFI